MPRLLVFQHVAAEPLGTLDPLIRRRGHRIRYTNFERHPDHEPNVDRYRGLIVLGGPMNVEDQDRHPHLLAEMRAIERMLQQGKPVLGICLGAQLLAHVLGAPIRRNPIPEIGWHRLHATDAGRQDPVLAPIGDGTPVFQWHNYRFDIPDGAEHLASTDACAPQAFRYGDNAYGFQFHMEMDQRLIERWLANPAYRSDLESPGMSVGDACATTSVARANTIIADTQRHIVTMQTQADAVFNRFLDLIGRPQRRFTLPSKEWD
ncbi:type 1 glutamine amidotransferase [Lysobacter fragariae]